MPPGSTDERLDLSQERISLSTLPYDLLLNIAQHLDLRDIHAIQLTCRTLHDFATTRPVFRNLAVALLRRCRALPLAGFQRLSDLATDQLVSTVNKATRLETAWLTRTPRQATSHSLQEAHETTRSWYKVISAPPNEEVDWLSPITSCYSLCATKNGKVVCWDVQQDVCLAEWNPPERWELWKCRVEFDIRTVFFTMARVLQRSYDDRVMEFVLMKLDFPDHERQSSSSTSSDRDTSATPTFSRLATFKTIGAVMNVFLLDPPTRLLSAFVWVSSSNTIGLYTLLDWDKPEYVFIDTGIKCLPSSNWSCILYKEQIVIHSEESDCAHQYFYALSTLRQHLKPSSSDPCFVPSPAAYMSPSLTMNARFTFPPRKRGPSPVSSSFYYEETADTPVVEIAHTTNDGSPAQNPNPFPFPQWYPESAHFVRQWWPSLPTIPRLSCTVLLLSDHDMVSHGTRYVLMQHYFKVPLFDIDIAKARAKLQSDSGASSDSTTASVSNGIDGDYNSTMKIWYMSEPFEVVCFPGSMDDESDDGATQSERARPLMAVDFGHAVWIEYANMEDKEGVDNDEKRLRFVSFPPVASERDGLYDADGERWNEEPDRDVEGIVRTLELPEDLDLDSVETINIDQSQGAVIISVREGQIFILYYE